MTMPPPSLERQQVVIPAQGMIDVRDALTDILSEFGVSYSCGEMWLATSTTVLRLKVKVKNTFLQRHKHSWVLTMITSTTAEENSECFITVGFVTKTAGILT